MPAEYAWLCTRHTPNTVYIKSTNVPVLREYKLLAISTFQHGNYTTKRVRSHAGLCATIVMFQFGVEVFNAAGQLSI